MSNTLKYIITVITVAAIIVAVIKAKPQAIEKEEVVVTETPAEDVNREICYLWNSGVGDSAKLRMTFTGAGGSKVTGSFEYIPEDRELKRGPIEGTAGPVDRMAMARTADLIWRTTGEGKPTTEQLRIVFGEGIASFGFGEMKDRGDGVLVYTDQTKVSYPITLNQTDCDKVLIKQ